MQGERRIERSLGCAVGNQFDGLEQTAAANVADIGMIAKSFGQQRRKARSRSLDPVDCGIDTVIWCTGFEGDFGWVRVPGVLDARGQPVHEKGVAAPPGIYFAGLDLAITRKSGTLFALIEEPQLVVEHILARR